MADVEMFTFKATAGQLQEYASHTLKALLLDATVIDNDDEAVNVIGDISGSEITGGTYTRVTLTGVSWDVTGELPSLRGDDLLFEGLEVEDPDVVRYAVVYSDDNNDLVCGVRFTPQSVTGDLPIAWREGILATLDRGTGPVVTVAGVSADDGGDVDAETLAAALDPYIEGGGTDLPAVLFAENLDASGGSFTDVVLYGVGEAIPRAYLVGADMLVVEGDDLATIWTITASGPCTVALEATPGLVIGSASSSQGLVATAVTADGTYVTGWVIQATEAYARAQAFEGENALRYAAEGPVAVRQFDLCAQAFSGDHDDGAWTTPKPASFSGGVWIEALVTVTGQRLPASPSDGDTIYMEIASQTADSGVGNWDAFEFAVQGTYSAATGRWTFVLFWEHTSSGASGEEDYQMSGIGSLGWSFTVGVPTRVAVWVDFTDGTSSTGYLLREAPSGGWSDLTAAGRNWRIVTSKIDAPTDIDPALTEPWGIGLGHGAILTDQVVFRNGGPSGTIEASPSAADAYAAGDAAFADAQTNTWTPGSAAATTPGNGSPARIINTDGDPGVTIYVGTVDPATDYSPVAGDVWIEP